MDDSETRSFRRSKWFGRTLALGCAIELGLAVARAASIESRIDWITLAAHLVAAVCFLFVAWFARHEGALLEVSPEGLMAPQGAPHASNMISWNDLIDIKWRTTRIICFSTSSGGEFVVSPFGLSRADRREFHRLLERYLPFYGPPSQISQAAPG